MGFEFIGIDEALQRPGLRMVVVGGIPSPWGEAAKGIFHIKGLDWAAVRLDYTSDVLKQWTGGRRDGPVAIYNDEAPRHAWDQILLLAERLAPQPALLPAEAAERALVMGWAHEICGEGGLGWMRRLQLVHSGLQNGGALGGFAPQAAAYLGRKYGYRASEAPHYGERVVALLHGLAEQLKRQRAAGRPGLIGESITAVDVYLATFMGLFRPLPPEHGAMDEATRQAFSTLDEATAAALAPELLAHRDAMYRQWLGLPLRL
ncbi:hypothetical protein AACH06_10830 [Ideonella sp. DXS29W]|uniref:Glutathione S-transferase n=1 Tax=Ideonella lacteola TaxID=2984193 RepID=A0ABU9BMX3_9BURK